MSNVVETETDVDPCPARATEGDVAGEAVGVPEKVAKVPDGQTNEDVKAQYTQEFDGLLDSYLREEEEVRRQIAELQARLPVLARNRELVTRMRASLDGGSSLASQAQEPQDASDEVAAEVPHPREARDGSNAGASASGRATKRKPKKSSRVKGNTSPSQLVYDWLSSKPGRSPVSEIREGLQKQHRDLTVTDPWVRNALNTLIRQNRVERTKQDRAVYFEAIRP
ncbi:hypothetical protein ACH4VR_36205 [Streptomyces sp. NPDC020883]|uniref:hypothetical protein n=1 Tax=Streptomyces sp. NPDC020883 TaxID=3365099 RepID=UPI00378EC08E